MTKKRPTATKKPKKITLEKETVRNLTDRDLEKVGGAGMTEIDYCTMGHRCQTR
jgi:hypothetical protein